MADRRLLYLANGATATPSAQLDRRLGSWGLEVEVVWAPGGDLPRRLDGYCGILLSGSPHGANDDVPFIRREQELIRDAAAQGLPMLGLCFGSQILAAALCGSDQVFRRSSCEVGFKDLPVTLRAASDPLMHGLGPALRMFVWHNDEVRADHPDISILAQSDDCPNQIWRYRDAPIWGIQGHPELTADLAADWFAQHGDRLRGDGADPDALAAAAGGAEAAHTPLMRFAALVGRG